MPTLDRQPTLAEGPVVLRPLVSQDWTEFFAAAADRLIWAAHPAHDRWQEPVFRRFFDDALRSGGALAVTDAATGDIIGSSRYDHTRAGPGEVEIGWTFLVRSHWGSGTNAVMKRLMLSHALQAVERVIFLVGEGNVRSRRAMEKVGASLTDRTHVTEMAGTPVTHVIYAVDRKAFADGPLTRGGAR